MEAMAEYRIEKLRRNIILDWRREIFLRPEGKR